jgi:hypothetical protein
VSSKYTRKIPLVLYIYKTSYELLVSPWLAAYDIFDDSLYEEDNCEGQQYMVHSMRVNSELVNTATNDPPPDQPP